jgi:protein TonB
MRAGKFIIPFVVASLAGHALVIGLTTRIHMGEDPPPEKVLKVELKSAREAEKAPEPPRNRQAARPAPAAAAARSDINAEDSVALNNPGGPYESYLLQIRRKIESLWSYPPQAVSRRLEGSAVIRFTIDARGGLSDYYVTSTSGSPVLDEGALAVVRAASPFSPLPPAFKISRLHITATFRYRMNP